MSQDTDILLLGDLDLNDHVNFFKLEGVDWGTLSFEREQHRKLRGVASWGPQRRDGWVEVPTPPRILVKPSTPGDGEELRALLGLLQVELLKAENEITMVPKGMITPVRLPVVCDPADVPDDMRLTVAKAPIVELHLWRAPYAYLDPVAVGPTTLATPCVVDLSAMTGEYPAPLDMLFAAVDPNDLTDVWVSYIPESEADACAWVDAGSWLVEAEGLSWSDGEATSEEHYNPDWTGGTTDNGWTCLVADGLCTAQANLGVGPPGPVRCLCRAGGIGDLAFESLAVVSINGDHAWSDLGSACLPSSCVQRSGEILTDLSAESTNTLIAMDRYAFLPTRWGYWHWKKATSHAHTIERIGETLFVDDICDLAECVGAGIEGLRGRLLVVAQGTATDEATHAVDLTYPYTPRVTLW